MFCICVLPSSMISEKYAPGKKNINIIRKNNTDIKSDD